MGDKSKFITGLLAGLGLAFILDPERGARRRAQLRDKATQTGRQLAEGVEARARELRNRAQGAVAEVRSRLQSDEAGDEPESHREADSVTALQGQESRTTSPG
jgi:hypothetical protein